MTDRHSLLKVLQSADSFFPGGATSISSGLEGLTQDNVLKSEDDVANFVFGQLRSRWAVFDRGIVIESGKNAANCEGLAEIDQIVEAQTLSQSARDGSKRTGNALLGVHVKLETPFAGKLQDLIQSEKAHGHNCVVQGMVWKQCGSEISDIEIMSAHCFMVGLVGAALRLGFIGHVGAQKIISRCHDLVKNLISVDAPDISSLSAFTPQQEIALMRHENTSNRLFIN